MAARDPQAMYFDANRTIVHSLAFAPDGAFSLRIDHHRLHPSGFPGGRRLSVRAVVRENGGDRLLLVRSEAFGDYKFPGGGVEAGEDISQALARELREEAGHVLLGQPSLLGSVQECCHEPGESEPAFILTSRYYRAAVGPDRCEQRLDDYEAELGFRPAWQTASAAAAAHRDIMASPPQGLRSWIRRETVILDWLAGTPGGALP